MDIKKSATSKENQIHKLLTKTGQEFTENQPSIWIKNKSRKMQMVLSNNDIYKLLNNDTATNIAKENNTICLVINGWVTAKIDPTENKTMSRMTIVASPDGWYTIIRTAQNPSLQIHDTYSLNSPIHELLMEVIANAQNQRRI